MPRPSFSPSWKHILAFLTDKRTDWKPKALLALAVAYLLWPIDLMPDFIPVVGWFDDLGLGTVALWYLSHVAKNYLPEATPDHKDEQQS